MDGFVCTETPNMLQLTFVSLEQKMQVMARACIVEDITLDYADGDVCSFRK